MELYQLRYFAQVARCESVSKAAEELHVSQPALSKAVAKLEEELGAQLFERKGKRLYLNSRGRQYLTTVERVLRELGEASALVGGERPGLKGSVSVGVFGAQSEAVECITGFMLANPEVFVAFDARQQSMTSRTTREFDLVFYGDGAGFDSLAGLAYAQTELMLCVPELHPLAQAGVVDLAQFKDESFVFMNTTAGDFERAMNLCRQACFTPRIRAVTSSGAAQMRLIQEGLGIGLVDTMRLRAGKRRGVTLLEIREPHQLQTQRLACRPVELLSAPARSLLDHALACFGLPCEDAARCFAAN